MLNYTHIGHIYAGGVNLKRLKECQYLDKLNEDESYIEYFSKFAHETLRIEPEYMKEIMEEVLAISRLKNYGNAQAESLLYLSWYYYDKGKCKKAIKMQVEVLHLFMKNGNKKAMSRTYNALLASYMYIGMYKQASECGLRGIEIAEELQEEAILVALFMNISSAFIRLEKYSEAYEMAMRIKNSSTTLNKQSKISLNCIMSEIKVNLGHLDGATKYYERAHSLIESEKAKLFYAEIYNLRGYIHYKKQMYSECEKDYNKAIEYAKVLGQEHKIASILYRQALYLYTIQDYYQAKEKVTQAIELSKQTHFIEVIEKAYELLSLICEQMKQYKEALDTLKTYKTYKNQLNDLSTSLSFKQLGNKVIEIKANMYETLYKKLEIISQIGQRLTTNLNIEQIFDNIYQELEHIIDVDNFGIGLYKEEKNVLSYEFFIEQGTKYNLGEVSLDREDNLGVYCLKNQKVVFINNLKEDYKKYLLNVKSILNEIGKTPHSIIYYPLTVNHKNVGVLTIQSSKQGAYNNEDLNTLKIFASYVAIAIWNAILFNKVNYLANYDCLTEILNRREILKMGETYYKIIKSARKQLGVIMFDIDYFKSINDQYGHVIGDEVLKKISEVATACIANKGFIGRYGGEEFIILLPDAVIEEAYQVAEGIRIGIMETKQLIDHETDLYITISLGIYLCDGKESSFEEGINLADTALYKAKGQGRNCVVCYEE